MVIPTNPAPVFIIIIMGMRLQTLAVEVRAVSLPVVQRADCQRLAELPEFTENSIRSDLRTVRTVAHGCFAFSGSVRQMRFEPVELLLGGPLASASRSRGLPPFKSHGLFLFKPLQGLARQRLSAWSRFAPYLIEADAHGSVRHRAAAVHWPLHFEGGGYFASEVSVFRAERFLPWPSPISMAETLSSSSPSCLAGAG
jgi:hypothetical protein